MNPRRFLNFFRSPTGALALFLIGLVIILLLVNSRRPSHMASLVTRKTSTKHTASAASDQSCCRNSCAANKGGKEV